MKKVLIIAPYFIPRRRVGALRPYRFAKHFSEFDWDPFVLCIDTPNSTVTTNEEENLENVEVYTLKPPFDRTLSTSSSNSSKNKTKSKPKPKASTFTDWFDRIFPVDTWLPFLWLKKRNIIDTIRKVNPDVIWSTSDPWSGAYIAGKAAKKTGVKWIADFRDPWTLCSVRFPTKGKFAKMIDKKIEKWIVKNVDYMTFTAQSTEQSYLEYYPELQNKTSTIYNSFNDDIEIVSNTLIRKKVQILFLGTFRWLSNAELIIKVLKSIKDKEPDLFKCIEVISYGNLTGEDLEHAKRNGVDQAFILRNKVPNEEVQKELSNSDVLLLSTHPNRTDIVPAKLFDYLPSEKPILSLVQNNEVNDILKSTGRGVHFSVDKIEDAADLLIDAVNSKKKGETISFGLDRKEEEISNYSSVSTTKQLVEVLDKVCSQ